MKWEKPNHSKKRVAKSGQAIAFSPTDSAEFKNAAPVFYNWRASHAFPMQAIYVLLNKHAKRVDKKAICVQRLKRSVSILRKLMRFKKMNYSRMQDIAGCRAVVKDARSAHQIAENIKKSRTKNKLIRYRDYISEPKFSGYRGIHLVYAYNGSKVEYLGLPVELQIRSVIQHSWATAVEVVGAYTKQALKASSGQAEWLNFFEYVSVEFSKIEGFDPPARYDGIDTIGEVRRLDHKLRPLRRLGAFSVATAKVVKSLKGRASYYILLLDLDTPTVRIKSFSRADLDSASTFYDAQEQRYKDNPSIDVVMVSAKSIKDLKKAYPNYFLDTAEFARYLELVYASYEEKP